MAIAFDSVGTTTNNSGGSTISWPHTINSNLNGVLLVSFGATSNAGTIVASPKFAGINLTKIITSTSNQNEELWYLKNPPSGLGTINGTWSTTFFNLTGISLAYTGVSQITPIAGSTSTAGTATSGSITDTSLGSNNLFVGALRLKSNPGTTNIGNERGTAQVVAEGMMADNTTGTIRWTFATGTFIALGAELNIANGAGTNLIQSSGTSALSLGSISATWGQNTISGHLIVVGVTITNSATLGTVTSVIDTQGNSYSKAVAGTKSSSLVSVIDEEIWYAKNIVGGAGSVTVNHTVDAAAIFVREYSGFNTLDATGSAVGSSATPNTGTLNTNFANELIIVSTGDDNIGGGQTYTAAGTYGDMVGTTTTLTGVSMEDALQVGTASQTGTLTLGNSSDWVSLMATFYNVSGAASPGFKSLLGVGQQ